MATIHEAAQFNALAYEVVENPDGTIQLKSTATVPTGWSFYAGNKEPVTGQTDVVFTKDGTDQVYIAARGVDNLGDLVGPGAKLLFGVTPDKENDAALAYFDFIKDKLSAQGYTSFQGGGHSLGGEEMAYVSSWRNIDVLIENAPNTVNTTGQGLYGDSHVVHINQSNDIIGNWGPSYSNTITIDTGAWSLNQFLFSGGTHSIDRMNAWIDGQPGIANQQLGSIDPILVAVSGVEHITWGGIGVYGTPVPVTTQGDTTTYHIPDGSEVTVSMTDTSHVSTWSASDGSSGSSTLNFDGSSTETTISSNGVSSTRTVNVDGNTLTQNNDASGTLGGSTWNNVDGSAGVTTTSSSDYSSIIKNADGGFSYTTYSLVNNASHNPSVGGFTSTTNADNSGSGTSRYADGSLAGAWAFNADGSVSYSGNNEDGSLAYDYAVMVDGSATYTWHQANGDISSGSFNAVSGSGTRYALDGSMVAWDWGDGALSYTRYAPDGTLVGTSNLSSAFQPNALTGLLISYRPDGGVSDIYSTYAYAHITYNSNGSLSRMLVNNPDGSASTVSFSADGNPYSARYDNADGESSGTYFGNNVSSSLYTPTGRNITYLDGSLSTYLPNGDGSSSGALYRPDGSLASTDYVNADRSYTSTTYDGAGGVYSVTCNPDGSLNFSDQYYANGSRYRNTFNPDGNISSASYYNPDGSYNEYSNGAGGSHSSINHNADGTISSSDVVTINADGSNTETVSSSDGSHSTSTTYPDGSSSGLNYKADGSYISFINDGLGSVTTNFFGASGNALGLSVSINDAQGSPVSTIYDVNGIVLGVATGSMAQQVFPAGASAIQFVSSISSADLAVSQDSQGNFLISCNNGTGTLDIPTQSAVTSSVEASFANGTSWQFVNAAGNSYDFTAGSGVTYLINPSSVQFGAGIASSMITLGLGSLMLRVGNSGDLLHIEGINPADALNSGVLQSFTFADGTTLSYSDLLARGFDIYGTTGNEILTGTNLNDRIYGDDGNDTLQGGVGNDTYLFNLGGGQDTINDGDSTVGNLDTIRFGAGVAASDITFSRSGNDLVLGINGTTDQVKIQNWGYGNDYRIEQVLFADGTAWDAAYLQTQISAIPINGTNGDDYLYGDAGNNTLDGRAGNDYLNGGYGNDVYLFNLGDGQDAFYDYDPTIGNLDTIRFGVGIVPSDITFTRSRDSLVLGINGTTDQLTIQNWGSAEANRIERVEFADGTVWDAAYLQAHTQVSVLGTSGDDVLTLWTGESGLLQGLEGNDDLSVIDGNNTLDGGAGNDYLTGGLGNNVYIFDLGGGQDVIVDGGGTVSRVDTVRFGAGILPAEINFALNGTDLVLGIKGTTDQLTIWDWTLDANFSIDRVEFADGTVWDAAYLQAQISALPIVGTTGNDYLNGDAGNNTFDGGAGNDTLYGNAGNDTYLFNLGGGQDTIGDADPTAGNLDTIRFGAGIAESDITFTRSSMNLVLGINGTTDQLKIQNWGYGDTYHIERVEFADGSAWDAAQLQAIVSAAPIVGTDNANYLQSGAGENATLQGLGGDDYLYGNDGNDTLEGGAGNDYLSGGIGNDTYLFNLGGGQDTIGDADSTAGNLDTIRFGAGVAASDITFSRSGNDLVLGINGTTDQLKIQNWGSGDAYRIERVEFAEGTVWDAAYLQAQALATPIIGTNGDDYLYGDSGNNTLDGGAGNDTLYGDAGNDTYLFNLGDGQDTIDEYDDIASNVDTIRFGSGIAASDITFTRSGNDLVLGINGTTDQLTIQYWGYGDAYRIERVEFADGTVWDAAYLQTQTSVLPIMGTTGDDYLNGDAGNNTFDGGAGNDTVYGDAGNDTYLFNLGDGQDTINDSDFTAGNLDTIRFGAGIVASDITFTRSGNDLVLGINGTTDQLTIQYWGYGDAYRIERVEFADGTVWDVAQIQSNIAAVSDISGTDGGDNLLVWAGESATLHGLGGDDYLQGMEGNDTLDGGTGNDYLSGSAGNDTYLFNLGGAQDMISDGDNATGNVDTIRFGAGIGPSDITFTRSGMDLVLGINGTSDQLTICDWGYGNGYRIERLEFADGTAWDTAYLQTLIPAPTLVGTNADDVLSLWAGDVGTLQGLDGNDELTVIDGNNTLDGGVGNDYLTGGLGDDVYVFNSGDGQDEIEDWSDIAGSVDTVRFGAGILPGNITFTFNGGNLVLGINGTTDQLTILNWAYDTYSRIERVEFADGTVWDAAYLQDQAVMPIMGTPSDDQLDASNYLGANGYLLNQNVSIQGLEGNDSLYGGDGNDRLDGGAGDDSLAGGAGNDTLIGGEGNDTYAFNLGDGTDTISDAAISLAGAEVNTLVLGAGITAAMITPVISAAGEVTLDFGNGDSIRINRVGNLSIQNIQLADGSVIAIESLLNAPPVAVADSVIVSEDAAQAAIAVADLLVNDTDPDAGDTLSLAGFDAVTAQGNTVSQDAAGNLVIDIGDRYQSLGAGQTASDSFTYTVSDAAGLTSVAAVDVTVTGVNDAPVVAAPIADQQTNEDAPFSFTVQAGTFTDIDNGDTMTYSSTLADGTALPSWLTFDAATGTFSGIPTNWNVGNLNVAVSATDAGGLSATSNFMLNVINANDPPTANADTGAATEDGGTVLISAAMLLANDTDPDFIHGDVLNIVSVSQAASGAVVSLLPSTGSGQAGDVQYDAVSLFQSLAAGQTTTDTFSYTIADAAGATSTADVTMTITGVNDASVTTADTAAAQEDITLAASGNVLANDTDVDQGTVLGVANAGVFAGSYGSLTLLADGSYSYALDNASLAVQSLSAGQVITETFAYQATDGLIATPSTLTVTITGSNDAPVTTVDTVSVQEDLSITATGNVLSNDSDVDQGTVLGVANAGVFAGSYGSLTLLADGSYSYALDNASLSVQSLAAGQTVTETFAYQATDGIATTPATLTVNITGTNDAPIVATPIAGQQTNEDAPFSFTVPVNTFTDIDNGPSTSSGQALTYSATLADGTALPSWLSFDAATQTFSGTPGNWDVGGYSVTVTATDTGGLTASSVFAVDVANVNDAPTVSMALADHAALQDVAFSFVIPAGTFGDVDFIHGDTLTYGATLADGTVLPSWLTFDAATQTFSGTPLNGDVGNLNVLVAATDTGGLSASSAFTLNVINVNDTPTANADTGAATEDGGAVQMSAATLLTNDTDPDFIHGDVLNIVSVTQADSGAAVSLASGAVQYDTGTLFQSLGQGQTATDTFSYTVSDMAGATSTATVTMTVTGVNDGPVTANDAAAVQEDLTLVATGNVLSNDTDVDQGTVLTVVDAGIRAGSYGSLVLGADGGYSYALDNASAAVQGLMAGQTVTETFAYQATDGIATTPATLTVTITGSNDAPVAQNDAATVNEDSLLSIQSGALLANDTDADIGDTKALVGVDALSALGSSVSLVNGQVVYDHGGQFNSLLAGQSVIDSFGYAMTDSAGAASSATVSVTVTGVNDGPQANGDSATMGEDTPQTTLTAASLLANDFDPDTGDALSIAGFDSITALGNTVSMDTAGNLVFDIGERYQSLAQGEILTDTFSYTITDTAGATSTAQVNMTIAGLNDAPVAAADVAYVREDLSITATGNVLGNDTDIDQGTVLSVADAGTRAGSYGTLTLAADGSYSYAVDNASPTVQSLGRAAQVVEHFGYTATDGMVGASSVLDVFLNGANDAPILVAPLADQYFTRDKHFSWQMPEGSFTDIDQGDTLGYAATLADGSALPDWLNFDAATRTFSGETPKQVGFVDVQVTATDSEAATGSIAGSLSASDVFRISVSHGNEGVGNGKDAPPPGHDRNTNDGGGTAPGRPGSPFDTSGGGNGHPADSGANSHGNESEDRSSDSKASKGDNHAKDNENDDSRRTDELIRIWFEEESTSERYSSFSTLDRHGAWGGQVDRQVRRNVARGISGDVSSEWERMNAQLKKHLEQSRGDDAHFSESGTGSRSFGLFGSGGQQGFPQLGTGNGQQLKVLAGLKEGLERLGC